MGPFNENTATIFYLNVFLDVIRIFLQKDQNLIQQAESNALEMTVEAKGPRLVHDLGEP